MDFIRRQMKAYPVTLMCKVMKVSRSGFYDHNVKKTDDTPAEKALKAKACRRFKITTDSRHSFPIAPNVLDRQFNVNEPNKAWAADISYAWTLEGWLYLAIVMELFSRQIVGWAVSRRLKKQLALDALAMAYWRRKPNAGLIHHFDRGSQYAYCDYKDRLKQYGMIPSMSKKGDCWDNAPTERFLQSLKSERLLIMSRSIISPAIMQTDCIQPWAIKRPLNMSKNNSALRLNLVSVST